MANSAKCADHALIESFWSKMHVELLDRRIWRTRVELANAIFEYLEIFHNRQRRHSALGMLDPSRVRDSTQDSDSGLKSSHSTPRNPRQPRSSVKPGSVQDGEVSIQPGFRPRRLDSSSTEWRHNVAQARAGASWSGVSRTIACSIRNSRSMDALARSSV